LHLPLPLHLLASPVTGRAGLVLLVVAIPEPFSQLDALHRRAST